METGFGGKKTQTKNRSPKDPPPNKTPFTKVLGFTSSFLCGRQPVKVISFSTFVLIDQIPPPDAVEQSEALRGVVRRALCSAEQTNVFLWGQRSPVVLINTAPAVLSFSKPDGLPTTGGDYFNCVIVTWLRDDSVSCRYFKARFLTSLSSQRLICALCLCVVAFGHMFEVLPFFLTLLLFFFLH